MRVAIGPVAAAGARAWIASAREILAGRRADDAEELPAALRQAFAAYLDEWEDAARGDRFRWEAEVDPEVLEYLVHGFYRVVTHLAEEAGRRGVDQQPREGDAFYRCLVDAVLEALSRSGPGRAAFAEELRSFWPGMEDPQ